MKYRLAFALLAGTLAGARTLAQDRKHPTDKCPPGTHTVTVARTVDGQIKPGGIGVSGSRTETHQVCRDNKLNNVKEPPRKRR